MLSRKKLPLLLLAVFAFFAFSNKQIDNVVNDPWKAPKEADELKNPFTDNEKALKAGKKLYSQMCSICHGSKGKGDGMAGGALNPKPTNFTSENVQNQSDGALYWKMSEGRSPMASYKGVLKEEQRWQLVNYIRSFKK
jgi:mono/diheme cytochrome c family protein